MIKCQQIDPPGRANVLRSNSNPVVGRKVRVSDHFNLELDKVIVFSRDFKSIKLPLCDCDEITARFEGRFRSMVRGEDLWKLLHRSYRSLGGQKLESRLDFGHTVQHHLVVYTISLTHHDETTPGTNVSVFPKAQGALDSSYIKTPEEAGVKSSRSIHSGTGYSLRGASMAKGECGFPIH